MSPILRLRDQRNHDFGAAKCSILRLMNRVVGIPWLPLAWGWLHKSCWHHLDRTGKRWSMVVDNGWSRTIMGKDLPIRGVIWCNYSNNYYCNWPANAGFFTTGCRPDYVSHGIPHLQKSGFWLYWGTAQPLPHQKGLWCNCSLGVKHLVPHWTNPFEKYVSLPYDAQLTESLERRSHDAISMHGFDRSLPIFPLTLCSAAGSGMIHCSLRGRWFRFNLVHNLAILSHIEIQSYFLYLPELVRFLYLYCLGNFIYHY